MRLFEPWLVNGKHTLKPMNVHITRDVPKMDGEVLYARGRNPRHVEQWPALMEKAFAGATGSGYRAIVGGDPADAMAAITGYPSKRMAVRPQDAETLYTTIREASRARKPMATFTFPDATDLKERMTHVDPASRAIFAKLAGEPKGGRVARPRVYGDATGVVANHAYTVLGVSERNGQKMVHLRNPWGGFSPSKEGYGKGVNPEGSGIFSVPLGVFSTLFRELSISNVPPLSAPEPRPSTRVERAWLVARAATRTTALSSPTRSRPGSVLAHPGRRAGPRPGATAARPEAGLTPGSPSAPETPSSSAA